MSFVGAVKVSGRVLWGGTLCIWLVALVYRLVASGLLMCAITTVTTRVRVTRTTRFLGRLAIVVTTSMNLLKVVVTRVLAV